MKFWKWMIHRSPTQEASISSGNSRMNQVFPTSDETTCSRKITSAGLRCESLEDATQSSINDATTAMNFQEHEVQRGDWLHDISHRHNVDFGILLEANPNLTDPDSLLVGTKIKIPQFTTSNHHISPVRAQPQTEDSSPEGPAYAQTTITVAAEPEIFTPGNMVWQAGHVPLNCNEHRVVEGDSLEGIAEKYGTTVCALKKLNNLLDDILNTGSIVKIEKQKANGKHQFFFGEKASVHERNAIVEGSLVSTPQPVRAPTTVNPLFSFYPLLQRGEIAKCPPRLKTVKVQSGNTLSDIAFEHGLTIWELQQHNNLEDDLIIEGDVLAISMGTVKKGPLELRHGQRRTSRILFSRQPLLKISGLDVCGPETTEKVTPLTGGVKHEGKWKHKKKGFQQRSHRWLHFSSPLPDCFLSSPFGWRWGAFHEGVDLAAEQGTPIIASDKGTVSFCGWRARYGYLLAIQHEGGFTTRYAHCCAIHTHIGQQVQKGQHVASVGATGRATGPHLHFEVRRNGEALDPSSWVKL